MITTRTRRVRGRTFRCLAVVLVSLLALLAWPAVSLASTETVVPIVFPFEQRVSWADTFGAPRGGRSHSGNDIMVPKMTPLLAVADGVLDWMNDKEPYKLSSYDGTPYFNILLRGDDGNCYFYIHLNNDTPGTDDAKGGVEFAYAPGLHNGSRVTAGQLIGYAGDSGNAENTGSHLHFELHLGGYGNPVDPYESLMAAPLFVAWDVPYKMYTGKDRYETAVMISKTAYPDGAPAAFLVKGDDFPDALAAAPLASAYEGPVVLTPSSGLTPAVIAELQRLEPQQVFITGLPDEVKAEVAAALPGVATEVIRGEDRYETAVMLAQKLVERNGSVPKFVLASGDSFPDALSVAPLAAKKGWAILLTPQKGPLPEVTAEAVGGLGVVSALVVGTTVEPPGSVTDVTSKVGADRYETSAMIATYAMGAGSNFNHTGLAKGTNYPDALVVGPYLAQEEGVLLLTRDTSVPGPIRDQLSAHKGDIETLDVVGLGASIVGALRAIR